MKKQTLHRTNGKPIIGLGVMYPSPGVIERIGPDWDWIWLDGQHGELDYSDILGLVRACNLVQRPVLVRVPGHDFGAIGKALDTGADGIIVPCVDTPEQALNVVNAAKFPPLGGRSYGGRRPIDLWSRSYSDTANDDVLLVVQIESPTALENIDAIAAIPGVDALYLGPDDIMLRRGHSMTAPRPVEMLQPDVEALMAACRKHNKVSMVIGGTPEMQRLCFSMGVDLVVIAGDVPFLVNGSAQAARSAREILAETTGEDGASSAAEGRTASSLYG